MKCGIIGATGKLGTLLMDEALKRGLEVTALVRDRKKLIQATPVIEKDILAITKDDIQGFDVVISAFGAPFSEPQQFDAVNQHLIDLFSDLETRLIVIGGAASLYTDDSLTTQLIDTDIIGPRLKPYAQPQVRALKMYQASSVNWTFFSPAINFDAKGRYSHDTRLGTDVFLTNNQGQSYLSYLDAAQIIIDEVLEPQFIKKRFTATSNQPEA